MVGGETVNSGTNNRETEEGRNSATASAVEALRKNRTEQKRIQDEKHSAPTIQYNNLHRRIEHNSGKKGETKKDIFEKTTDRQAIEQEFEDWGVTDVNEARELAYSDRQTFPPETVFKKYKDLFHFLGEDTKEHSDVVKEYQKITDRKNQLWFIADASLSDQVRLFCSNSFDRPNYDSFMRGLESEQEKLTNSDYWMEDENVRYDLRNMALHAAMVGTPELKAIEIATEETGDEDLERGLVYGGHVGQWLDLCDEYGFALNEINAKNKDDSPEQKEQKATEKLASWIVGAADYTEQTLRNSDRRSSYYYPDLKESFIASRLSDEAMRRLAAVSDETGTYNIKRFIGKSGYSQKRRSMEAEKSRLNNKIQHIYELPNNEQQEFLANENASEIKKQRKWREKEHDRIQHKYDKLIGKTRSEERKAVYEQRRQEELQKVEQDVSEHIAYYEGRAMPDLINDTISRIDLLSRRVEKEKSLADKAFDLYSKFEGHIKWNDELRKHERVGGSKYAGHIDWINCAPFGVINRAHRQMTEGVPKDKIYESAIDEMLSWPNEEARDRKVGLYGERGEHAEIIKAAFPEWGIKEITQYEDADPNFLRPICSRLDKEEIIRCIQSKQMDIDTLKEYPWLAYQYVSLKNRFGNSIDGPQGIEAKIGVACGGAAEFAKQTHDRYRSKWCSDRSVVWLDGEWSRQKIGKVIFTRLQAGVDYNVHNASQWLEAFQMPEKAYNIPEMKQQIKNGAEDIDIEDFSMRLFDRNEEKKFLAKILSAPQSLRDNLKLSTKPQNINKLFSTPEHILIYNELAKIYKNPEIDFDEFKRIVRSKVQKHYDDKIVHPDSTNSDSSGPGWRMSSFSFRTKVDFGLEDILEIAKSDEIQDEYLGEMRKRLIGYSKNRKTYTDDATTWLISNAVTPQQSLIRAWNERALAIADGTKDNPSEIERWAKLNSFFKTQTNFLARNGVSRKDLSTKYAPFVDELTRCYASSTTANGILMYKNMHNPEKLLPAKSIKVEVDGRKFIGEVLTHDDPRGMTIGADTGCCMTVDGWSDSCIESGYRDPGAGFFAYYDANNRLVAQSYFFTHPKHPDVVVMDNIEANEGRDSDRIVKVYQEFFRQYLVDRFANDPDWQIRQVNVGTGCGEVAKVQVQHLDPTEIVPNSLSSYSDAREDQRLLIRLTDAEIAKARRNIQSAKHAEKVVPNHSPTPVISPLGINQLPVLQQLESQLYPESIVQYDDEDFVAQELMMPGADKYSFLVKTQEDANSEASGYCLAYEEDSRTEPDYPGKVVYIADFGILPEARSGMTSLKAFDELLRRINENGINKVEMDARESTSYRVLTSDLTKRYLANKGFEVVEHDDTETFGDDEKTYLISLEKINPVTA